MNHSKTHTAKHRPIPRKTYPEPAVLIANAGALQEIIDILDKRSNVSTDLRELREIIELAEMAFVAAVWQRQRASAAMNKLIKDVGWRELGEIERKARQEAQR